MDASKTVTFTTVLWLTFLPAAGKLPNGSQLPKDG